MIAPHAAHPDQIASGLEAGKFPEAARVVAEGEVFVIRKQRPAVLKAAVDAAILDVADTIKFVWPDDGQGLEKHRMHQGEDGGGCPDAQRQGQHCGGAKTGSAGELPEGVAGVIQELHGSFS